MLCSFQTDILCPLQLRGRLSVLDGKRIRSIYFCLQVQEAKTPLAAAVCAGMDYADAWGPAGFPVPLEKQDGDSFQDAISVNQAMTPNPLVLHRAVWAQAQVLSTRCQLILRAGETLSAEIRRKADLVRSRSN